MSRYLPIYIVASISRKQVQRGKQRKVQFFHVQRGPSIYRPSESARPQKGSQPALFSTNRGMIEDLMRFYSNFNSHDLFLRLDDKNILYFTQKKNEISTWFEAKSILIDLTTYNRYLPIKV